ncbi:MAG: hypothetical protein KC474_12025, partial [Cyanobacteria bacterium HKST-UBA04]|nr:hypothetical protein [Cyanobacteria bacterium HKST-UBA04]
MSYVNFGLSGQGVQWVQGPIQVNDFWQSGTGLASFGYGANLLAVPNGQGGQDTAAPFGYAGPTGPTSFAPSSQVQFSSNSWQNQPWANYGQPIATNYGQSNVATAGQGVNSTQWSNGYQQSWSSAWNTGYTTGFAPPQWQPIQYGPAASPQWQQPWANWNNPWQAPIQQAPPAFGSMGSGFGGDLGPALSALFAQLMGGQDLVSPFGTSGFLGNTIDDVPANSPSSHTPTPAPAPTPTPTPTPAPTPTPNPTPAP